MKIMRIDEADPVPREEQDFSIRTLRDLWGEVADSGKTPHTIRGIKNCDLNRRGRTLSFIYSGSPCIELGAFDSYQTARRIEPKRVVVTFNTPVNLVARQSVFAGQRGQTIVLQTAQPAFSGDPERALVIK